ncbi:Ion_trans domain-containing protein [Caenorhabditis elegans]|uniref:Ion_trans domain-containing protein n=1 Tax=Caenorhabditis elegans TaxID=6239 RepID=P91448_CAEEL|nr:Ion_trans domain-containing protein [Caenorhabditis elegans]CCD68952.1 Ion_trans domain-containing protein [Caenorhabditis elegans]|eukprot:NP_494177.4 TRP-channel-Like [Caenorhabditis elegans]
MSGSRSSSFQQQSASQALLSSETTKITIEADAKNRETIRKLLEAYEQEHNVFKAHGIKGADRIFNEIENILLLDLNIKIVTIYNNDKNSAAMIIAAFFGRRFALDNQPGNPTKYVEKDLLSECHHPLHTIMVMCYIAHVMQKKFLGKDSGYEDGEVYEKLKNELEDIACKIVSHLNSGESGADRVAIVLQADYKSEFGKDTKGKTNTTEKSEEKVGPYHDYLNRKFDQSREIMAIAYKAKARKFLSLRPCLHLMETRNKAVKTIKHTLNWTFRLAYILMFAYMLCRYPFYSSYDSTSSLGFWEMLPFLFVPAVLIAQVSMTIIKSIDHLIFDDFKLKHGSNPFGFYFSSVQRYVRLKKLAFWRVCLVVPLLSLEAIRFVVFAGLPSKPRNFWSGGWVILPLMLELLYCSLFTIATISSLRFFHSIQSIGFFVHIFKKMMKTVGMFILIFCTFWFVLAVTHVSLSRTLLVHNSTFIYTLSLPGKFEIFGEVQDEDRIGILSN